MSFKFDYKNKKYWAKQLSKKTEVYLLEKKGLAEKVLVLDGKPELKAIELLLNP